MIIQQLVNGLTVGCSYALVTLGFSMIYSVLTLTNFAHSSFYMLGAYLVVFFMQILTDSPVWFLCSVILAVAICAVVSSGVDRILLRKIRRSDAVPIAALLCTVGVQQFINNGIILLWGSSNKPFTFFADMFHVGKFRIGNAVISWLQIILISIAIAIMLVLTFVVRKTRLGAGMRAVSQNSRAAQAMGVQVNKVIFLTFMIAGGVSAIGGIMVGIYYQSIETTMATVVGSKAFAAALLGGLGELTGAVLGGFLIGILETFAAVYINAGYRDAIAFGVLIIMLLVRPQGLLGKKTANKV